jgi:photosystem II stability/assembly factor-like uncharacterized protein
VFILISLAITNSYPLDSLTLLLKWEEQVLTGVKKGDTSYFKNFSSFLDTLSYEDKYLALCICHDDIIDSTIKARDYGKMEVILLHSFYPLFNRFWDPYYLNDSTFFTYAVHELAKLDTSNGLFYFLQYSVPAFTINHLEWEKVNWPENMIGRCRSIVDSVASLIQSSNYYPDDYRTKFVRFSFLKEIYTMRSTTLSENFTLSIDSTFYGTKLYDIFKIDSLNMYICGDQGIFAYTSNSAESWNKKNKIQYNLVKTVFLDCIRGFALTETNLLLTTNDGGQSWVECEHFIGKEVLDLAFIDNKNGIASTPDGVKTTNDGGLAWTLHSKSVRLNFIVIENRIVSFSSNGMSYSDDIGNTWVTHNDSLGDLYKFSIHGLFFRDSLHGYCYGNKGIILKTTDGGRNWVRMPVPYAGDVQDIVFFDEKNGIAVGDPFVILYTTDAGSSWKTDSLLVFDKAVECKTIDSKTAILIGESGMIYTMKSHTAGIQDKLKKIDINCTENTIRIYRDYLFLPIKTLSKEKQCRIRVFSANGRVLFNRIINTENNRYITISKKELDGNIFGDKLIILNITDIGQKEVNAKNLGLILLW